jgi:hypothetical protein
VNSDETFLVLHKQLIEEGIELGAGNPSVLQKYLWTAKYHNRVINSKWLHDHFTECDIDMIPELEIDLIKFPNGLEIPLPVVSDCPYHFNWDRYYPYGR